MKIKKFKLNKTKAGDLCKHNGQLCKFLGYEYGTYPILEVVETGEHIQLKHY